jgi:hypothetical protein
MVQKYEVIKGVSRRYGVQFEIEKIVAGGTMERYEG